MYYGSEQCVTHTCYYYSCHSCYFYSISHFLYEISTNTQAGVSSRDSHAVPLSLFPAFQSPHILTVSRSHQSGSLTPPRSLPATAWPHSQLPRPTPWGPVFTPPLPVAGPRTRTCLAGCQCFPGRMPRHSLWAPLFWEL